MKYCKISRGRRPPPPTRRAAVPSELNVYAYCLSQHVAPDSPDQDAAIVDPKQWNISLSMCDTCNTICARCNESASTYTVQYTR
eukprot:9292790-Pyramimonas_sp.AAC.1